VVAGVRPSAATAFEVADGFLALVADAGLGVALALAGAAALALAGAAVVDAGRVPTVADELAAGVDRVTVDDGVFLAAAVAGPPAGLAFGVTGADFWVAGFDLAPSSPAAADGTLLGLATPNLGFGFGSAATSGFPLPAAAAAAGSSFAASLPAALSPDAATSGAASSCLSSVVGGGAENKSYGT
jgi:hypothetical protein